MALPIQHLCFSNFYSASNCCHSRYPPSPWGFWLLLSNYCYTQVPGVTCPSARCFPLFFPARICYFSATWWYYWWSLRCHRGAWGMRRRGWLPGVLVWRWWVIIWLLFWWEKWSASYALKWKHDYNPQTDREVEDGWHNDRVDFLNICVEYINIEITPGRIRSSLSYLPFPPPPYIRPYFAIIWRVN